MSLAHPKFAYEKGLHQIGNGAYAWLQPDGGWGWMVVFGTVTMSFCLVGYLNAFGVLFPYLLDEFGLSRGVTSLLFSAQIGCLNLMNLISGGLSTKYGHRPTVLAGAISAFVSVMASSFVPNLGLLVLVLGQN